MSKHKPNNETTIKSIWVVSISRISVQKFFCKLIKGSVAECIFSKILEHSNNIDIEKALMQKTLDGITTKMKAACPI